MTEEEYAMLHSVLKRNPAPRWSTWLKLNQDYGLTANQGARLMEAALRAGVIYEHAGMLYNNENYRATPLVVHKDVIAVETKAPYTD